MINPFTISSKIKKIQHEVLSPLYSMHPEQENAGFDELLSDTGKAIANHQDFFEEVSSSSLVALIFKIIKLFGGADELTEDDFDRFTSYVNDGGLKAMVAMLLSEEKEESFVDELGRLESHVRENAAPMLAKSRDLHRDFINGYFEEAYGSLDKTPPKLQDNFSRSDEFIKTLAELAVSQVA
jgi:hypothetical protein